MAKWYDFILWIGLFCIAVNVLVFPILIVRKVLFTGKLSGVIGEFDAGDRKILKAAGYLLLTGLLCLVIYFLIYI